MVIDHISTYALNYPATKSFYQAVFSPLGYTLQAEFVADWEEDFPTRRVCGFGKNAKADFWIVETKEQYTPRHVAFAAANRAMVKEFHAQGLSNGGQDHGAPGLRPMYHEHYFGAFLIDPDGNNVEAVCHLPEG